MTQLASLAELEKLAAVLEPPAALLEELRDARLPSSVIRDIRRAIAESEFGMEDARFRRLAWIANRLPVFVIHWLAVHRLGPLIVARVAGLLSARKAAHIAQRLPAGFIAEVCAHIDPRYARDLISRLPPAKVVETARLMIAQGEYITMGRFVDFLPDDSISAVLSSVEDEEELVRIAYYVESRNRLDHVVRLMPRERLRKAILLVLEPERDLMLQLMSLVFHVSYDLQHELAELAAEQEEAVLNQIVTATQAHDLWGDLLPVIALLSEDIQRKVCNLPLLREDRRVLEAILAAAEQQHLWRALLPLVPLMDALMREAVADIATGLAPPALRDIAEAALMAEQWRPLAELVSHMPESKQREIVQVLKDFSADIDPELEQRLMEITQDYGFGHLYGELTIPENEVAR